MNDDTVTRILSELRYYDLSSTERHLVEAVRHRLSHEGYLTDQQECELELLYKTKEKL